MSKKRISAKPILSSKEDNSFREALKLYEEKQYKKALKLVETVLKKNSNHAESFSLKGIILFYQNEKIDADAYIKKGIMKGARNSIVCHISGIYYRARAEYAEAAKWYAAALENGSVNKVIYRDLSVMQSQIGDFAGLTHSRQEYLEEQPGYRSHWTSTGIAYHLNKEHAKAENTLTKFEELAEGKLNESDMFENSECLLYKNTIIGDTHDYARALAHLDVIEKDSKDKLGWLELRGKYLMLLSRNKEASIVYRSLLQRNPDNMAYYHLLETALGTIEKGPAVRKQLYAKLARFYPKSDPPKYIPLTFLDGSDFTAATNDYVLAQLKRGVPSTFVNVKAIMGNSAKQKIIEKLATEYFEGLDKNQEPIAWIWASYFLASNALYMGRLADAHARIDAAIAHTPTLVELYILKARIIKHEGDAVAAAAVMNVGRELDLQDRFINSKAAKYYLRANMVDQGIATISMFTKNDNAVNGLKDLHQLQANWVIVESASAYLRLFQEASAAYRNVLTSEDFVALSEEEQLKIKTETEDQLAIYLGLALKRLHGVVKIFNEYVNDQLDFHSYCMRRGTARAYIEMLKWGNSVLKTPVYLRTIEELGKLYLQMADAKKPAEDKKKVKKVKKLKGKDAKRKEEYIAQITAYADDADPLGAELLLADPLETFYVLWKPVNDQFGVSRDSQSTEIHRMGFEVYVRQQKYLLALQEVNQLKKVTDNTHPAIGTMVLQLKAVIANPETSGAPEAILKVVEKSIDTYFPELGELGDEKFLAGYAVDEVTQLVSELAV
ncbi:hypothetical protein BABINDRAFT_163814 [Babjeviella inositovora NRRL Y-12698]|uniref:Uncharacterized protein n=1 Tax=Babjeviella inositovora NRRL Y-12698 TaxID=984486 RepID=A0A1E3QHJ7_9ASCO|nr:uncharacterized protein BABINDRAFT_163814 [Babjeviella inositovora NRRL Y-12698]ODQ77078.1 hypothetical protein BABINDRAFT_163814 [Babjeviella inositovora NRRL Y-12698]